jgi:hypothetical protein
MEQRNVTLNQTQVVKLASILTQLKEIQSVAATYCQSIADANDIPEFENTELDIENNTLTFHLKETET